MTAYACALSLLSRWARLPSSDPEVNAFGLVALSIPAGIVYLFALLYLTRTPASRLTFWTVILAGFAMRSAVIASPPFLEDDYYRYLWDGAVTAHGVNPYTFAPTPVLWASVGAGSAPPTLLQLADEAGPVLERINHPHLTTIYPPIAQLGFAAAHLLAPWNTYAWRAVLLIADGTTLILILGLLRVLRLPAHFLAWYWWNPVLIRETFGAAHMDLLVLPFAVGGVLLALRQRFTFASLVLALGTGVKVWPVLLLAVVLRPLFHKPVRLLAAIGVFLITTAMVWWPAVPAAFGPDSGFLAYASGWQSNAGAFTIIERLWTSAGSTINDHGWAWSQVLARGTAAASLIAWIAWCTRRPISCGTDLVRRCGLVVAATFLLSPTQFPWYYIWVLPFLACFPTVALLSYSLLLPLYYLKQHHPAILWLEHAPVWILVLREGLIAAGTRWRSHARAACLHSEAGC